MRQRAENAASTIQESTIRRAELTQLIDEIQKELSQLLVAAETARAEVTNIEAQLQSWQQQEKVLHKKQSDAEIALREAQTRLQAAQRVEQKFREVEDAIAQTVPDLGNDDAAKTRVARFREQATAERHLHADRAAKAAEQLAIAENELRICQLQLAQHQKAFPRAVVMVQNLRVRGPVVNGE